MDCSQLTQDPIYKALVKDWEWCKSSLNAAREKEYLAWKKITEMEEEFLKTRIHSGYEDQETTC